MADWLQDNVSIDFECNQGIVGKSKLGEQDARARAKGKIGKMRISRMIGLCQTIWVVV